MVIISSQPFFIPFLMASFLPMGAGCVPVWVGRVVGSMETLSREISPLRSAAVEMTEGRDRCHSWHVIAGACIRSFSLLTI